MPFVLGSKSLAKLNGVHPDLVKVVKAAIKLSEVDFTVLEGLRTLTRQKQLLAAGATRTLNSRHLTGHAVDLGALIGGTVRWDWPLYFKIADAMKAAAADLGIPLEWGGDWRTFKDGPHFQLPFASYPKGA
jgi:peptidoglycan L-alanyl-D-glutamate endopeptidase CwlK